MINTSIGVKSLFSKEDNYKIKLQLKENHPERIEITEFTRESYSTENLNLIVLVVIGAVLTIITIILLVVGTIFVIFVLMSDIIFFFGFVLPLLKSNNQINTFYITESQLIAEEIAFKRVKTNSWYLSSIKKINLAHTLNKINNNYAVNVVIEDGIHQDTYTAHTLILLPQNPSNLEYCEDFMAMFKEYDLPVDSTEITTMGTSKRFKAKIPDLKHVQKVSKRKKNTIAKENIGEVKCFACGTMSPTNSSYCMNCGSSL